MWWWAVLVYGTAVFESPVYVASFSTEKECWDYTEQYLQKLPDHIEVLGHCIYTQTRYNSNAAGIRITPPDATQPNPRTRSLVWTSRDAAAL